MKAQNFSREKRLTKPCEFRRLLKSKCIRAESDLLTARLLPNSLKLNRLGFTVPKKKIKLAFSRNQLKRVVREQFRTQQLNSLGYDIVINPKTTIRKFDRNELNSDCMKLWKKIELQLSRGHNGR